MVEPPHALISENTMQPDSDAPVEILSIGTEVVLGRIQDTNASWLAAKLSIVGANVRRITAVSDDPVELQSVVMDMVDRDTGLVVSTGGLGPTPDDLTVDTFARAAGCRVEQDNLAVEDYRNRRGISKGAPLPPSLNKMASVPTAAQVFVNPVGWAPAFMVSIQGTVVFAMPGPPREVEGVYCSHLAPMARDWYRGRTVAQRIRVDMHESEVSPLLEQVMSRFPQAYLKAYVALSDGNGLPIDIIVRRNQDIALAYELEHVVEYLSELVQNQGVRLTCI